MNAPVRPTRVAPPPPAATVVEEAGFHAPVVQKAAVTEVYSAPVKRYPVKIAKAIIAITRKIQPIVKAGENTFHHYKYAKWEDILGELGPLIAENGLIIIQNEVSHGGFESDRLIEITYDFTIINEDGDEWPDRPRITAICKIKDHKGIIDDKAASKCHTQAHKYAMVQLFKIRTADMADHDADNQGDRPAPNVTRRAPAPDGTVKPYTVPTVKDDNPASWAERFGKAIATAKTVAEVDEWWNLNSVTMERVKSADETIYNQVVEIMDEVIARIEKAKPAAPATATPAATMVNKSDPGPIPEALRRAPPKTLTIAAITDDAERDWLIGLRDSFAACEGAEELLFEKARLMDDHEANVSALAWKLATGFYDEASDRIIKDNT